MNLAIFDLDNTLIDGDINAFWGKFLVEQKLIEERAYFEAHHKFHEEYLEGSLQIEQYLCFTLGVLSNYDMKTLTKWRDQFIEENVRPKILPKAIALVEQHHVRGDTSMIITASNRFIAEPVGDILGVHAFIASEPEMIDNQFTGKVFGIPSYRDGKIKRLEQWLTSQANETVTHKIFYSDSHNDLPLLSVVDKAVAVDPDDRLRQEATQRGWPIISLKIMFASHLRIKIIFFCLLTFAVLTTGLLSGSVNLNLSEETSRMILALRLNRVCAAFVVGGMLALAGSFLQILLRNPLAEPYTLGISGGAVGLMLVATLLGVSVWWSTSLAWLGALFSMGLLYYLAIKQPFFHSTRLLLFGVMVSAGWSALITLLLTLLPQHQLSGEIFWLMGDLTQTELPVFESLLLVFILLFAMRYAVQLNILRCGELKAGKFRG